MLVLYNLLFQRYVCVHCSVCTSAVSPQGLSEELFVDLCEMLPRIFRVASTRNLTKK